MATKFVREGCSHIPGLDNFQLPKVFTKIVLSISSLRLSNMREFIYCISDINDLDSLRTFLDGVISDDGF
jgi:hypothetical protein